VCPPALPCKAVFIRTAALAATFGALIAAAVLAPSAGATQPCPVEYCTDSSGEYVLEVAPLNSNPYSFEAAYASCTWDVHVDFGDDTAEDYVFVGTEGLTGSHRFPESGVTYRVVVQLSNGESSEPDVVCLNPKFVAEVRYRTPEEEADDPPAEPGDEGEGEAGGGGEPSSGEPGGGDETAPAPAGASAAPAVPAAAAPATPGTGQPASYWRRCRRGVRTHLVGCRRGASIARRAARKLRRPGASTVAGFRCRLPQGESRPILCRRRARRILAPA
jgi:hypothetical protein